MDRSNLGRMMLIALVAATLGGCGSDGNDGVDGTNGRDGIDGVDGTNGSDGSSGSDGIDGVDGTNGRDGANGLSALVDISPEPAGANCAGGGSRIDYGQDTNGNAVLDIGEISRTQYVCNGALPATYTIGGTVAGLAGTLVLQNNANGYLTVSAAGSFTFGAPVSSGDAYAVSVLTRPRGQTCTVTNGSGNALANVTSVQVNCATSRMTAVGITPAPDATDVDRMVAPSMVFSAALDAATVVPANVTLRSPTGDQPITLSVAGTQLTATPMRQLLPGTSYTLRTSTDVTGNAGELLGGAVASSFRTRDGQWQMPALIQTDTGGAPSPRIAVGANGTAFAVWLQAEGSRRTIWANRLTAGSGWGTATLLETIDGGTASGPRVAVDISGNAMVAWTRFDVGSADVRAKRYTAGSGWSTATVIETSADFVISSPEVEVDAAGNVFAVWSQPDGGEASIWANRYTPDVGWGTATPLETTSGEADDPQIAVDANGNALAVWYQFDGARSNIWANRYTPGSGWGTATLVETNDGEAGTPEVAMDGSGNGMAVWIQSDGTQFSIWANRYIAGSGWSTATLIETNAATALASRPQIAVDAAGNALAVWAQFDGMQLGIWANRYTSNSGWSTATLIETNGAGPAQNPRIAMDPAGNALAVWVQSDGTVERIWSNRYIVADGDWSTAAPIVTPNPIVPVVPDIAVDASGNALAVWPELDGTRRNMVASRFE